MDNPEKLENKR